MAKSFRTTARLILDGSEVPLSSFEYSVRPNEFGASLNATLANRKVSVNKSSTVEFAVGVIGGSSTSWVTLFSNGRVTGKDVVVKYAGDELRIQAVNPQADKWALRPPHPITIYDTNRFSPTTITSDRHYDLRDVNGNAIAVEYVPVNGLDLTQALHRAYVDGCGFSSIVTNLPNYGVWRVDFSVQEGFHAGVAKYTQYFSPLFFSDDQNRLFIIDVNNQLPAGVLDNSRKVGLSNFEVDNSKQPVSSVIGSAMLSFKEDINDPQFGTFPLNAVTVFDTNTVENGVAGQEGWQRTQTIKNLTQFHEDLSNPNLITRTVESGLTTRVWAMDHRLGVIRSISVGVAALTREEIQTNTFENRFYLPTGYTKIVNALAPLPFRALVTASGLIEPSFVNVLTEVVVTGWALSSYNPDEWVKRFTTTTISGLVIVEGNPEINDLFSDTAFDFHGVKLSSIRTPIIDAANLNAVAADGSQTLEYTTISTEHQIYNEKGAGQLEIIWQKVNQLNGMTESGRSFEHIADAYVRIDPWRTLTELIDDAPSVDEFGLRKPLQIDAYEVPYDLALPVAERKLARGGNPPATDLHNLPAFDAALSQGCIRRMQNRKGKYGDYIVTGYNIKGDALGTANHRIYHNGVQGVEVLNA